MNSEKTGLLRAEITFGDRAPSAETVGQSDDVAEGCGRICPTGFFIQHLVHRFPLRLEVLYHMAWASQ